MKPASTRRIAPPDRPAAFRRLCVETISYRIRIYHDSPAAFRRLCVETLCGGWVGFGSGPAAFRRLCVETART